MLRLLGLVISIALADSLNPSTVGPALYLAGGKSPRRDVLSFTAGVFVVFLLGGLILTLGPGHAILSSVPRPDATTRYILETIAGVAMLIAAQTLWLRRGKPEQQKDPSEARPSGLFGSQHNPLLLGAGIALVELPTAFPYFAAIAAVVGSGQNLVSQIVLIAIYNVCFVLPLLAIVLMLRIFGARAVEILSRAREYLRRRWRPIVAAISLIVGIFVVALGVTGLIGQTTGGLGRFSRRVRRVISR